MTDTTLEILEKRLHMTPSEIKRLSRESDLLGKTAELEKKLLLLESHGLLSNIPTDEKPDICSTPLFRCTYSELEFAMSVPELLPGFISENWYSVFSVYSDPVSAVRMLEDVFERESMLSRFSRTP